MSSMLHENYGVSASDVLLHDEFKDLSRDPIHPKFNDLRVLYKVLWELGLNINEEIEERLCTHRNLQRKEVTCIMYRGAERTDKQWLKSGCASLEAIKSSTRDISLRIELDKMRNRG